MTKLLLDFPWQYETALDTTSEASATLLAFDQLCTKERLQPLGFVGEQEFEVLIARPGRPSQHHPLQVLLKCLRADAGQMRAAPIAGPNDLSEDWKQALGAELSLEQWRTPQIVATKKRGDAWKQSTVGQRHKTEAVLRYDNSANEIRRVLAFLESYDAHLYAQSDRVPWDLQRRRIPEPHARDHQRHPCLLPMPPILRPVRLEQLAAETARVRNWIIGNKHYYLPPDSWTPAAVDPEPWRQGHTFPHANCPHCGRSWPVDRYGRVWCWDEGERHWDVQFAKEYWSVSNDGTLLKKKKPPHGNKKKRWGRRR